jgi:hypothetical protein
MSAAIEFDTSEFEFSHGTRPRGLGSWAFRFILGDRGAAINPTAPDYADRKVWWAPTPLTYGEAKKWARAKARELGTDLVEVCS